MLKILAQLVLIFIFAANLLSADEEGYAYKVEFHGIDDPDLYCLLTAASQLVVLESTPPKKRAALKLRIDDDIPNLLKALQSMAYYHPRITYSIDESQKPIVIHLDIVLGPIYPFVSFKIVPANNLACPFPLNSILPQDLGIELGSPALPEKIVDAEDNLLSLLTREGYPLAKLQQREVIADQTAKSINVVFHIETGPLATFGKTDVVGDEDILPVFFSKKIAWSEGERYNPYYVARTLNALEASGLFSSINISHDETANPDGSLPMHIVVQEARQRSIAFGVGYATDLGAGASAEWEHRNFRGFGDKLSVVARVWQIKQEGHIRYVRPDFGMPRQDLIWQAEVVHEITKGFRESAFNLSGIIERQMTDHLRISYGGMFTRLRNSHSNNNGDFNIFKIPCQLMWTRANSLLDPTSGINVHFKTTPAVQTLGHTFGYCTHLLTTSAYQPLDDDRQFVLAAKSTFGSIWGASDRRIPPSERFYAGSDNLLRGYRYLTVSPLGEHHKPIGGRSLMAFSLEARVRVYDPFGVVFFYDVGNVYRSSVPNFNHKQLQSLGIGFRYHTPVGPLRIDLAFPLNPRKHLDRAFQLYFSIGQSF